MIMENKYLTELNVLKLENNFFKFTTSTGSTNAIKSEIAKKIVTDLYYAGIEYDNAYTFLYDTCIDVSITDKIYFDVLKVAYKNESLSDLILRIYDISGISITPRTVREFELEIKSVIKTAKVRKNNKQYKPAVKTVAKPKQENIKKNRTLQELLDAGFTNSNYTEHEKELTDHEYYLLWNYDLDLAEIDI